MSPRCSSSQRDRTYVQHEKAACPTTPAQLAVFNTPTPPHATIYCCCRATAASSTCAATATIFYQHQPPSPFMSHEPLRSLNHSHSSAVVLSTLLYPLPTLGGHPMDPLFAHCFFAVRVVCSFRDAISPEESGRRRRWRCREQAEGGNTGTSSNRDQRGRGGQKAGTKGELHECSLQGQCPRFYRDRHMVTHLLDQLFKARPLLNEHVTCQTRSTRFSESSCIDEIFPTPPFRDFHFTLVAGGALAL